MTLAGRLFGAAAAEAIGTYVATVYWYPLPRDGSESSSRLRAWHPGPDVSDHTTLDAAERHARQWGCMAGVRRVEVHGPDGTLQALWDKESRVYTKRRRFVVDGRMRYDVEHVANRWQRLGEESQSLHRQRAAELFEQTTARGRTGTADGSPQV